VARKNGRNKIENVSIPRDSSVFGLSLLPSLSLSLALALLVGAYIIQNTLSYILEMHLHRA